ncbi:MAG: FecR domain-containing protein [Ignavibacteria bacterium]|jgi:ferric-dicitrate binding protein FerR (iron transport regulator)
MKNLNNEGKLAGFLSFVNGEFTNDEKKEFERILNESDELKKEFEEFKRMWENFDMVTVPEELNIDRNFAEIEKRIKHKRSFKSSLKAYIVSKNIYQWEIFNRSRERYGWTVRFAALLFFAILSYQVFLVDHSPKIEEIETANVNKTHNHFTRRGEKAEINLPDGSKVFLNSSSKLTYYDDFNATQRFVRLEGEAFFDIAPDKEKIFFVSTKSNSVRVVGTKFNVYERYNEFVVAVAEGKVTAIQKGGKSIDLEKNQIAEMRDNKELTKLTNIDINQFLDWRNNRLSFRNEPLEKVMKEIEITFNVNTFFEEESLRKRSLTGSFDAKSLDEILTAISISLNVDFERKGNSIQIY